MKSPATLSIFCLSIFGGSFECNAWSTPRVISPIGQQRVDDAKHTATMTSGLNLWNEPREFLSKVLVVSIAPPLLAAALLFGVADDAVASDETLLFDLSKQDSIAIETRAPPEIKASSSEQAMALSKKMKTVNAKMYGAYW